MAYITSRDRVRIIPPATASWQTAEPAARLNRPAFLRRSLFDAPIVVIEAALAVAVISFFGLMFDSVIASAF